MKVENEVVKNKKTNLEKFIEERIVKNATFFTNEEIQYIKNNDKITLKIYLLGILDSKNKKD